MNREDINKLREKLTALSDNMEELVRVTDAEQRQFSEDENNRFKALDDEHKRTKADIDRRESVLAAKASEAETTRVSKPQAVETSTVNPTSHIDVIHPQPKSDGWKRFGNRAGEAAYRSGQWILGAVYGNEKARNWCQDHGMELRAGGISVLAKGGILVPDELDTAIIDLREQYGVAEQWCRVVDMSSDHMVIPRRSGGLTAYPVGENTEIIASDKAWNGVELTARKWGILAKYSSELSEDAAISIADDLASEAAAAFAEKMDDCLINGTGAGTYHGIQGIKVKLQDTTTYAGSVYTAAAGNDAFSEYTMADLTGLSAMLPAYAIPGASWYCSQVAYTLTMQRLALALGGVTMTEAAGSPVYRFMGYPVKISQKLPTSVADISGQIVMLFGDMSKAVTLGRRRGTRVQVLTERYAELDQLAIVATTRWDINVHDIGNGTTAGPIVGLEAET